MNWFTEPRFSWAALLLISVASAVTQAVLEVTVFNG